MQKLLCLLAVCAVGLIRPCLGQVPGENLFNNSGIHVIRMVPYYSNLRDTLETNYMQSFGMNQFQIRDIPYAPVKLIIDGTLVDSLGIRYKGFNSWWHSVKKPIKIDINRYNRDQVYDGLKKFNLHNGSGDPSFVRENISYKILMELGVRTPRTSYAQVYLDTAYQGLYRVVEQIDNTFLDAFYHGHQGNLYVQEAQGTAGFSMGWEGADQAAYYESLSLENHKTENDWSAFIHFLDVLNNTSDRDFRDSILSVFDVYEYLRVVAFDVTVNNLDFYGNSGRNFYLYDDGGTFHFIPWDYNLTWREGPPPINFDPNDYPVLIRRILQVPEFHSVYEQLLCWLKPLLTAPWFDGMVMHEYEMIGSLLDHDPYQDYPAEAFQNSLDSTWIRIPGLRPFAAKRNADIADALYDLNFECKLTSKNPVVDQPVLKIYPIPAHDWIEIGFFPGTEVNVSVLNNIGQMVMNFSLYERGRKDISRLPVGYYSIRVIGRNQVYSGTFIVGN
jgi:hypothetical protein